MAIKITALLYRSKTLANGEHPLMLRLTDGGKRKYLSLGISCPAHLWDFNKAKPKRSHPDKRLLETIISQKITAYHHQLLYHPPGKHSLEALIKAVEGNSQPQTTTVFPFFEQVIARLLEAGKVGNANVYKDTRRSLKLFTATPTLSFTEVDQQFLHNYEVFLRKQGLAETSISVYFRTLRALLNKALQEKLLSPEHYPFKEFKVAKFNTTTQKRAMTKAELKQLENLPLPPASPLQEARHYFLFSYYGQGINFRDIAQLRWNNMVQDRIVYTRAKTGQLVQFKLLPPAWDDKLVGWI